GDLPLGIVRPGESGLVEQPPHRAPGADAHIGLGAHGWSDGRVPRRTTGDTSGLSRRGTRGWSRCVARLLARHAAVTPASDVVRCLDGSAGRAADVHARLCAHAGWSVAVARYRGHGPSHLSDGIWTAGIRAGECAGRRVCRHAPDPEMATARDPAPAGS